MSAERKLEAQRRLTQSFVPEGETRGERWPERALDAACRAGHAYFVRKLNPSRAVHRFNNMPERTRLERRTEFVVSLEAFVAAGGI